MFIDYDFQFSYVPITMATWEKVTKTVDVLHSSEPGSVLTGIKDHRKNHGL